MTRGSRRLGFSGRCVVQGSTPSFLLHCPASMLLRINEVACQKSGAWSWSTGKHFLNSNHRCFHSANLLPLFFCLKCSMQPCWGSKPGLNYLDSTYGSCFFLSGLLLRAPTNLLLSFRRCGGYVLGERQQCHFPWRHFSLPRSFAFPSPILALA